ncbi:hypothetical protein QTI00_04590 [Clostridium perfringens]|nr:hypothetical protein [Clostridium perfringens]MDM0759070.1 hypothetical protein [Clostridium perfringens]
MDARNLELELIKEGISKGNYEITGVLETGEITISLVTKLDKDFIRKVLEDDEGCEEKLRKTKKLIKIKGRPAQEIMQVYEQKCNLNHPRCKKNNLRIK